MENQAEAFQDWMNKTRSAAMHLCREGMLYDGVEGCRRFARECAPAIICFGEYGEKHVSATYGAICVAAYNLRPPVNAKQWLRWMWEVIEEEKAAKPSQ